jgi:hypothetical protein
LQQILLKSVVSNGDMEALSVYQDDDNPRSMNESLLSSNPDQIYENNIHFPSQSLVSYSLPRKIWAGPANLSQALWL